MKALLALVYVLFIGLTVSASGVQTIPGPDVQKGCYSIGSEKVSYFALKYDNLAPETWPNSIDLVDEYIYGRAQFHGFSPHDCKYTEKSNGIKKSVFLRPGEVLILGWMSTLDGFGWFAAAYCPDYIDTEAVFCVSTGQDNWTPMLQGTSHTSHYQSAKTNQFPFTITISHPRGKKSDRVNQVQYSIDL